MLSVQILKKLYCHATKMGHCQYIISSSSSSGMETNTPFSVCRVNSLSWLYEKGTGTVLPSHLSCANQTSLAALPALQ